MATQTITITIDDEDIERLDQLVSSGAFGNRTEALRAANDVFKVALAQLTSAHPRPESRGSSARSLLRHAGTWVGNDLHACLEQVHATRAEAKF